MPAWLTAKGVIKAIGVLVLGLFVLAVIVPKFAAKAPNGDLSSGGVTIVEAGGKILAKTLDVLVELTVKSVEGIFKAIDAIGSTTPTTTNKPAAAGAAQATVCTGGIPMATPNGQPGIACPAPATGSPSPCVGGAAGTQAVLPNGQQVVFCSP